MSAEAMKQELMKVLEEEVEVFQRMLGLLTREQEALTRDDAEGIKAAVQLQQKASEEVRLVEARRLRAAESVAKECGVVEPLTLNRLCELYSGHDRERMGQMRDTLLDLHAQIRKTNRNNALLIRHALRYIDRVLLVLKGIDGSNRVYKPTGTADNVSTGLSGAVNQVA